MHLEQTLRKDFLKKSFFQLSLLIFLCFHSASPAAPKLYSVDWTTDSLITGGNYTVMLVPYLFGDSWIRRRCPTCSLDEIPEFERSAVGKASRFALHLSDGLVSASILAAILVDGLQTDWSPEFIDDMLLLAETLSVSSSLVTVTKFAVQRPLPLTYAGDPVIQNSAEGYRSFYSGHTSTAAAALGFLAYTTSLRQRGAIWPWVLLGTGSAAVGIARVEAGRHFYSDILVGALVGSAIGVAVPALHRTKPGGLVLTPLALPGGAGLVLSTRL